MKKENVFHGKIRKYTHWQNSLEKVTVWTGRTVSPRLVKCVQLSVLNFLGHYFRESSETERSEPAILCCKFSANERIHRAGAPRPSKSATRLVDNSGEAHNGVRVSDEHFLSENIHEQARLPCHHAEVRPEHDLPTPARIAALEARLHREPHVFPQVATIESCRRSVEQWVSVGTAFMY